MNIVYNKNVLAMRQRLMTAAASLPFDFYESFGTEYGVFIPATTSGYQFIRWLKNGMVDRLPVARGVLSHLIHITNNGQVYVVIIDIEDDEIAFIPYTSEKFSLICGSRENSEAVNFLLNDCTTIAAAVKLVDDVNSSGMPDPLIFFVSDWVEYAKANGYTKNFYHTSFKEINK